MPRTTLNIPQEMLDEIDKQAEDDFSNRSGALAKLWRDKWSDSTSPRITAHHSESASISSDSPSPARAPGSSSGSEEEKKKIQKKNKKGNSRLAPLDVSERIIGYLNEQAGTNMRPAAEGHRKHIQARLNKGATEAEMMEVIRKKCVEWSGTDMARHLNPETLFGGKFDKYLDQPESGPGGSSGRKGLAARLAEKQGGFFNGKW